jgi:branched-chain amino acid transport system permease protein
VGQHSDALERVLNYLRRGPMAGKLGILDRGTRERRFALLKFSGVRGEPPEILGDTELASLDAAYHEIFLMRLEALRTAAREWQR